MLAQGLFRPSEFLGEITEDKPTVIKLRVVGSAVPGGPLSVCEFVLGSAVPHPYELHLGSYSVHTSTKALAAGERNLRELKQSLDATGNRRTGSGSTPVFRK